MRDYPSWAEKRYQAMQHQVDKVGASSWTHPGDELDDREQQEGSEAGDIFRKLFASLLPERSCYGGMRRFKAGYHRMCALAFHLAPELFDGLSGKQVAESLGMTEINWRKLIASVRAELANGHTGKNPRQMLPRGSGSSPAAAVQQVPQGPAPSERVRLRKLSERKAKQ
jgi:hypothetical protein